MAVEFVGELEAVAPEAGAAVFLIGVCLGLGRLNPHEAGGTDEGKPAHGLQAKGVGEFDHGGVVPLAHVHHAQPQAAEGIEVLAGNGQVVLVDLKAIAAAALEALLGEEGPGVAERVFVGLLVSEAHAVAVARGGGSASGAVGALGGGTEAEPCEKDEGEEEAEGDVEFTHIVLFLFGKR